MTLTCRPDCAACCTALSISKLIPGMPNGKPAGVSCVQLDDQLRCKIFGQPERPAVCGQLQAPVESPVPRVQGSLAGLGQCETDEEQGRKACWMQPKSDTETLRVLYSYRLTIMSICTMLSIFEVDAFLKADKRSITGINWREGLLKDDVQWWKWDCAIDLNGIVPEGARLILQYRPEIGAASEKFNCGLLLKNERVYAIDFDQDAQHTNKVGQGRPYHGKRFGPGTHEHTWSVDGSGYAEPIQDFSNLAALFAYFCETSNLHVSGGFKQPPSQQLSLELI